MRVLKAIYLSVLFALAMSLFCGELPESMRLQDDTSNDFVADSSASATRENEAVRDSESVEQLTKNLPGAVTKAAPSYEITATGPEHSRLSGKKLLPLLSIRRT